MKFGKQLEHEAVAEWRPFYLDYNKMKRALKAIKRISQNEEADVDISPEAAASTPRQHVRALVCVFVTDALV